ncbi:hypothetical protein RvY_04067-1 [Ramazzottius varieornatus]|uniref:Uncharacterized protein n=1 Tax=Ramazzottius varieornatus TaxID=947166 RepID=A0A1D1V0C0_RAMVA|nr:hypothetical protein RvY_04067-1 [Ramazzottius varieornatus]
MHTLTVVLIFLVCIYSAQADNNMYPVFPEKIAFFPITSFTSWTNPFYNQLQPDFQLHGRSLFSPSEKSLRTPPELVMEEPAHVQQSIDGRSLNPTPENSLQIPYGNEQSPQRQRPSYADYRQELARTLGEYSNNFEKLQQLNDYYGHKPQPEPGNSLYPSAEFGGSEGSSWMKPHEPFLNQHLNRLQYATGYRQPSLPLAKNRRRYNQPSLPVFGPPPGKPVFDI